jgi:hypothetical protein
VDYKKMEPVEVMLQRMVEYYNSPVVIGREIAELTTLRQQWIDDGVSANEDDEKERLDAIAEINIEIDRLKSRLPPPAPTPASDGYSYYSED